MLPVLVITGLDQAARNSTGEVSSLVDLEHTHRDHDVMDYNLTGCRFSFY